MARRLQRLPGHREGVRRHQRYGQQALDLGRTLAPEFSLSRPCHICGSTTATEWAEDGTQLGCTDCGYETREFAVTINDELVEIEIVHSIGCVVCDDRGCEHCPRV